jgi:hypothetical protein
MKSLQGNNMIRDIVGVFRMLVIELAETLPGNHLLR